jgi:type 1 fimbria pilin
MKNIAAITAFAAIAAALVSGAAFAAPTAELKVTGVIKPPACTPNFASGGVVDYGVIPTNSLKATEPTALAEKSVSFTVSCDSAVKVAYRAIDNRQASAVKGLVAAAALYKGIGDTGAFGLGTAAGKNIGAYTLRIDPASVVADSSTPDSIYDQYGTWAKSTNGMFGTNGLFTKAFAAPGTTTPAAYKTVSATLTIQAIIDKTSNLPLSQDIQLDGSATLEVQYL